MIVSLLYRSVRLISGADIPAIDLTRYLRQAAGWEEDCKIIAMSMSELGVFYVKDPRVDYNYNWKLINLMEKYFALRAKQL